MPYLCTMKQNMGRLIRYILFIHKLSGHKNYVPAEELISYLNLQMETRGYDIGISQRTLQRDINDIAEMFDIEIKNRRGYGYYIAEKTEDADIRYEELLMNFDLLTSLNRDTQTAGCIIPEHHRPKGSDSLPILIQAIKERWIITFDYLLVRHGNKIVTKTVKPHFLKESLGLWYLLAIDESGTLKSYGIDRIRNIHTTYEVFTPDPSIDPDTLFKNCYGIWDDPAMPVEEVELSYSPLDGQFLKATPLHGSQQVLIDNEKEFRIRLQIKITNDFVMALLARSASLTVIKPASLRQRIKGIYAEALKRNK